VKIAFPLEGHENSLSITNWRVVSTSQICCSKVEITNQMRI